MSISVSGLAVMMPFRTISIAVARKGSGFSEVIEFCSSGSIRSNATPELRRESTLRLRGRQGVGDRRECKASHVIYRIPLACIALEPVFSDGLRRLPYI